MGELVLTCVAAFLHELGHITAAKILRVPIRGIRFRATGPRIVMDRILSCREEVFIALAGPAWNLISGGTALLFWKAGLPLFFGVTSLFLGFLNLLPFRSTDGCRILNSLLCIVIPQYAESVCRVASFTTVGLLWAFSVFLLLRTGSAILLFVFCLTLFFDLLTEAISPTDF